MGSSNAKSLRARGIDELHVHLLAKSPEVAAAVLDDLKQACEVNDETSHGEFAETSAVAPQPRANQGERRISV
jgi:hypothetical protein